MLSLTRNPLTTYRKKEDHILIDINKKIIQAYKQRHLFSIDLLSLQISFSHSHFIIIKFYLIIYKFIFYYFLQFKNDS